jgi:hypothetical protein
MFGRGNKKKQPMECKACGWPAGMGGKPAAKSRIVVYGPAGSTEPIYLRGEGAGLSWNKGLKLDHKAGNEWIWETYEPINRTEFKVLIDDKLWEEGPNHVLEPGHTVEYTAKFPR